MTQFKSTTTLANFVVLICAAVVVGVTVRDEECAVSNIMQFLDAVTIGNLMTVTLVMIGLLLDASFGPRTTMSIFVVGIMTYGVVGAYFIYWAVLAVDDCVTRTFIAGGIVAIVAAIAYLVQLVISIKEYRNTHGTSVIPN